MWIACSVHPKQSRCSWRWLPSIPRMLHGQESAISRWDLAVRGRNDNAPRKSTFWKLRLKLPTTRFSGSFTPTNRVDECDYGGA